MSSLFLCRVEQCTGSRCTCPIYELLCNNETLDGLSLRMNRSREGLIENPCKSATSAQIRGGVDPMDVADIKRLIWPGLGLGFVDVLYPWYEDEVSWSCTAHGCVTHTCTMCAVSTLSILPLTVHWICFLPPGCVICVPSEVGVPLFIFLCCMGYLLW